MTDPLKEGLYHCTIEDVQILSLPGAGVDIEYIVHIHETKETKVLTEHIKEERKMEEWITEAPPIKIADKIA